MRVLVTQENVWDTTALAVPDAGRTSRAFCMRTTLEGEGQGAYARAATAFSTLLRLQKCGATLRLTNVFPHDDDSVDALRVVVESFSGSELSWKHLTYGFDTEELGQLAVILVLCFLFEWAFELTTEDRSIMVSWSNENIGEIVVLQQGEECERLLTRAGLTVQRLQPWGGKTGQVQ